MWELGGKKDEGLGGCVCWGGKGAVLSASVPVSVSDRLAVEKTKYENEGYGNGWIDRR